MKPSLALIELRQENCRLKAQLKRLKSTLDAVNSQQRLRPQFGDRELDSFDRVFQHNAWDNVDMTQEQLAEAREKVVDQSLHPVPDEYRVKFSADAGEYWNEFYTKHENKFFKDRHWLFTEFKELLPKDQDEFAVDTSGPVTSKPDEDDLKHSHVDQERWGASSNASKRILEIGCGAGNTVFPLLASNKDPGVFVYACDFSSQAVSIVKDTVAERNESHRCYPFVCDISKEDPGLPPNSIDIVVMIFVLSAVLPSEMQGVIDRVCRCLKPGGTLLFRDYGRYDLAQLRFKRNRYISENFYVRGDGTQVYFFSQEDFRNMIEKSSANMIERQCRFDKRLIVNRAKQVTMHRVWLQCKFDKC